MSPVPTHRSWLPGAALLVSALAMAGICGLLLHRSWPWYAGFTAAVVLAFGWVERLWTHRTPPAPPRSRGKLKVIQGGKATPYDLEKDHSTDSQRYLM